MKLDLERIVRSIQTYYKHHLGLVLDQDRVPHLGQLARNGRDGGVEHWDNVDKMIVLVLGCAVTCPHRKQHIDKILSWPDIKVLKSSLVTFKPCFTFNIADENRDIKTGCSSGNGENIY